MLCFGIFKEDFITEVGAPTPSSCAKRTDGAMIIIHRNMFTVVLIERIRSMAME